MNNEMTITLAGETAKSYLVQEINYEILERKYNNTLVKLEELTKKYEIELDKNSSLIKQLDEAEMYLNYEKLGNNKTFKTISNVEDYVWVNPPLETETIKSNPIAFPATTTTTTTTTKPKSGTHWTEDELDVIKRSLESNYTLAFLKVKLSHRSEAAIRTKLLEYGIGVKNNKLVKK